MSETVNLAIPTGVRFPEGPVREAAVSSTVARQHPYHCPVCDCDSVLIEGQFRREFQEEFISGASQGHELADNLDKNILAITCPACQIRYVIEPDEMFKLREEMLALTIEVARLEGLNPVEMPSQKVM